MLSVQVDYWKLQESKRHNLAEESLGKEQTQQGWISAQAAADTASANLMNAATNVRNAATNERNAESSRITALANQRNAESNERNAATNAENARINAINAETNRKNAESQALQAQSAWRNATTNASLATYQTSGLGADLDRVRRDLTVAQKNEAAASTNLTKAKTATEDLTRNAQLANLVGKTPISAATYVAREIADSVNASKLQGWVNALEYDPGREESRFINNKLKGNGTSGGGRSR